jgi:hypothetical protein
MPLALPGALPSLPWSPHSWLHTEVIQWGASTPTTTNQMTSIFIAFLPIQPNSSLFYLSAILLIVSAIKI